MTVTTSHGIANVNVETLIYWYSFQFEYQQAQLEAEVENLSWKVERAEITDRGVSTTLFLHIRPGFP